MSISDLAHEWAHAEQTDSGKCGNLSYRNNVLYSYAAPIANKTKGGIFLLSHHTYSLTTSRHISIARGAAFNTLITVLHVVPQGVKGHRDNHDFFKEELVKYEKEFAKARSRKTTISVEAAAFVGQANFYANHFNVRRTPLQLTPEMRDSVDNADHEIGYNIEKRIQRWREFKIDSLMSMEKTYLRVSKDGKQVETSKAIKLPIEEAKFWWEKIHKCFKYHTHLLPGLKQPTLQGFKVDGIDNTGEFTAGCHVVPYAESLAIAKHFQWEIA